MRKDFFIIDHNRAQAQIGLRLKVSPDLVKNVIIWGNHSSTQYPDVNWATVMVDAVEKSVYQAVQNDHWLQNEFISVGSNPFWK